MLNICPNRASWQRREEFQNSCRTDSSISAATSVNGRRRIMGKSLLFYQSSIFLSKRNKQSNEEGIFMSQMTICFIIFLMTLLGFAFGGSYVSITVVSLIGMMAMILAGCLSASTALGCFANSSAILMASMFIVAAGLNRTQMVSRISTYISDISKGSFIKVLAGYTSS